MKNVLISIRPQWVEKITSRKKKIEVRKTAPKEVPFKAYIYCSYGNMKTNYYLKGRGKVIGEFVCDKVFLLHPYSYDGGSADLERRKFIETFERPSKDIEILSATCLSLYEMFDYIGEGNYGYGWHISKLKVYDKPKELSEFKEPNGRKISRPPQSWKYLEEI